MGEEGHASAFGDVGIADGAHAVEELDEEPEDQPEPGGNVDRGDEKEDEPERMDARVGELDQVGAHHAGDGAAGADHGDAGIRIGQELGHGGGGPAQQVKQQELGGAQNILDIVAEDPQEPHVAEHVHPTAVEEHGSEHAQKAQVIRHQAIDGDELVARIGLERNLEEEDQDIDYDQQHGDDWFGIARLRVA